jgi:hypothetical protein
VTGCSVWAITFLEARSFQEGSDDTPAHGGLFDSGPTPSYNSQESINLAPQE